MNRKQVIEIADRYNGALQGETPFGVEFSFPDARAFKFLCEDLVNACAKIISPATADKPSITVSVATDDGEWFKYFG